jgi:hypothetical protein
MEAIVLFVAVTALVLLAVTSMRFGIDSREGFDSRERESASRGTVQTEPSATRRRQPSTARRLNFVPGLAVPRKCVSAACGA